MSELPVRSQSEAPDPGVPIAVPESAHPDAGYMGARFDGSRYPVPPPPDPWSRPGPDFRNDDTAPQQIVDLPMSSISEHSAAGDVSVVLLVRAMITGVAAALLVVAAVLLFRHGIRPNDFPAYAAGTSRTVVERYSGPWIGGAAAAALLACLCAVTFGADLLHRSRLRQPRRPS